MLAQEIQGVFRAICEGLTNESRLRAELYEEAKPDKGFRFSLGEEREIGTAAVLCIHLRNSRFFTRMDWYFDGDNHQLRPDLAIWLPGSRKLLYLELKRVGQGFPYKRLGDDLARLEKISSNPENRLNGLLAVGFSKQRTNWELLKTKLHDLENKFPNYLRQDRFFKELSLEDMDGHPVYSVAALLLRKDAEAS